MDGRSPSTSAAKWEHERADRRHALGYGAVGRALIGPFRAASADPSIASTYLDPAGFGA